MTPRPPIYAHRLGGEYGPEGSRPALERSLAAKVDGLEVDVTLSRDLDVLGVHDPFLPIATDLEGWAHEHSTSEILAGRLRDSSGEPSDQHPLRLEELLAAVPPQLPIQLDVKAYADPGMARTCALRCCEIAEREGSAERVEILSFFSAACVAACERGFAARLVVWADYAPEAMVEWLTDHGLVGVSFEGFILSPWLCDPLREAGLSISVGAVNAPEQALALRPVEPDILVSDRPRELAEGLDRSD